MKKVLLLALALMMPMAYGHSYGAFGGINMTEFDSDAAGFDSEMGFEVGARVLYPLTDMLTLRTGAGYVQKNSSFTILGTSVEYNFAYIVVPVTVQYSFNEMWAIYGGLNLNLNVADEVDGATGDPEAESLMLTLPIGVRVAFGGNHNLEAEYELGLGDVADQVEMGNSMAVRYVYMFQ